jgi:hypothetical protein
MVENGIQELDNSHAIRIDYHKGNDLLYTPGICQVEQEPELAPNQPYNPLDGIDLGDIQNGVGNRGKRDAAAEFAQTDSAFGPAEQIHGEEEIGKREEQERAESQGIVQDKQVVNGGTTVDKTGKDTEKCRFLNADFSLQITGDNPQYKGHENAVDSSQRIRCKNHNKLL